MVRKKYALLQFHFNITSPELLTDEEFEEQWERLQFALWFEAQRYSGDKKTIQL